MPVIALGETTMRIATASACPSGFLRLRQLSSSADCRFEKRKRLFEEICVQNNYSLAGPEDPRFKLTVEEVEVVSRENEVQVDRWFTAAKAYAFKVVFCCVNRCPVRLLL